MSILQLSKPTYRWINCAPSGEKRLQALKRCGFRPAATRPWVPYLFRLREHAGSPRKGKKYAKSFVTLSPRSTWSNPVPREVPSTSTGVGWCWMPFSGEDCDHFCGVQHVCVASKRFGRGPFKHAGTSARGIPKWETPPVGCFVTHDRFLPGANTISIKQQFSVVVTSILMSTGVQKEEAPSGKNRKRACPSRFPERGKKWAPSPKTIPTRAHTIHTHTHAAHTQHTSYVCRCLPCQDAPIPGESLSRAKQTKVMARPLCTRSQPRNFGRPTT